jgi:hypothetical protein
MIRTRKNAALRPVKSGDGISDNKAAEKDKSRIEVTPIEGGFHLSVLNHISTVLDLFKTDDQRLAIELLQQAVKAGGNNSSGTFIIDMVAAFEPRDAAEQMLTMQMAATHAAMMSVSEKMNGVDHIKAHEVYAVSFNRLGRTFTTQMEAFRRHRTGGQSKITVEHVTVNEGGQAIVGNVERSGKSGKT